MNKGWIGWAVGAVIVLAPVARWAMLFPLADRFSGYMATMVSSAQVSGLIGMALYGFVLVLSARIRFFETFFGGLNRAYVWHHILGSAAFVFLLLHPLFSAAALLPVSLAQAGAAIWPGASVAILLGWGALSTMIGLLVLTLYFRPEYQLWKLTHKFLGLAFFLGGLHSFLIPSDMAVDPWLRGYMLSWAALALGVYAFHSLLDAHKQYEYQVTAVERLNDLVIRIRMKAQKKSLNYRGGQFAFFKFIAAGIKPDWHPFSLVTSGGSTNLEISVKKLGDFTGSLGELKPGIKVLIQGPYGQFDYRLGKHSLQVWLAGGVGITPFMGMAQDLSKEVGKKYEVNLIYAESQASDAFALEVLKKEEQKMPERLKVMPWYAKEQGFVSAQAIQQMVGRELSDVSFFLCGPSRMMSSLRAQLQAAGVPANDIHSEEFEL